MLQLLNESISDRTLDNIVDKLIEEYDEFVDVIGIHKTEAIIEASDIVRCCMFLMNKVSKEVKLDVNTLSEIAIMKRDSRISLGKNKNIELSNTKRWLLEYTNVLYQD